MVVGPPSSLAPLRLMSGLQVDVGNGLPPGLPPTLLRNMPAQPLQLLHHMVNMLKVRRAGGSRGMGCGGVRSASGPAEARV